MLYTQEAWTTAKYPLANSTLLHMKRTEPIYPSDSGKVDIKTLNSIQLYPFATVKQYPETPTLVPYSLQSAHPPSDSAIEHMKVPQGAPTDCDLVRRRRSFPEATSRNRRRLDQHYSTAPRSASFFGKAAKPSPLNP